MASLLANGALKEASKDNRQLWQVAGKLHCALSDTVRTRLASSASPFGASRVVVAGLPRAAALRS